MSKHSQGLKSSKCLLFELKCYDTTLYLEYLCFSQWKKKDIKTQEFVVCYHVNTLT